MKKLGTMCIIFLLVFLLPVYVSAEVRVKKAGIAISGTTDTITEVRVKNADIVISGTADTIKVGESVTLAAKWLKQGSSCKVVWQGADGKESIYKDGYCTSEAVFTPTQSGVFTIVCEVEMTSGKSDTEFYGRAEYTITVENNTVTVKGAGISDLSFFEQTWADGSIRGYWAMFTVDIVYTDNSTVPYSSTSVFFGPTETSKDVSVSVEVDGIVYTNTVTISR
jgi:hypothetical protein